MRFYGHTLSGKLEIHARNTVQFTQTISHLRKRKKPSQIKRLIIQLHIVIVYFSQQTQHYTMKQMSTGTTLALFIISICLWSCITSKTKPLTQVGSSPQTDSSSVRVFLLERDIPQDIQQLGVVSLSVNIRPGLNIDQQVKQQLRNDCLRLGANGAYRINDGTYYPTIVSYLVFRYRK